MAVRTPRPSTPRSSSTGDGRRAHHTAFAPLKHTHEKVRDHWEPKAELVDALRKDNDRESARSRR